MNGQEAIAQALAQRFGSSAPAGADSTSIYDAVPGMSSGAPTPAPDAAQRVALALASGGAPMSPGAGGSANLRPAGNMALSGGGPVNPGANGQAALAGPGGRLVGAGLAPRPVGPSGAAVLSGGPSAAQMPPMPRPRPATPNAPAKVYQVRKGDSLSKIAKANGTTVEVLMRLNPQIKNPNKIYVRDQIKLPS